MSKTVFSSALFEQMGGVNWLTRPGGVEFYPHNRDNTDTLSESLLERNVVGLKAESVSAAEIVAEVSVGVESHSEFGLDTTGASDNSSELNSIDASATSSDSVAQVVVESVQSPSIEKASDSASSLATNKLPSIVVLGAGLDAIWQNDETQAWQLWQNIMLAFDWDESQMTFFDTTHLVSDEMIFTTMEEVIELGVDWVLTMDDEHPISEQLVEGVHVVSVPDLESMLSDPYAKQSFYHAVVELSKQR